MSWLGHKNFASESYDFWASPHHWIASVDKNSVSMPSLPIPGYILSGLRLLWTIIPSELGWAVGEWGLVSHHFLLTTRYRRNIWGRLLFKHCTRQIYFFFIFIQQYTFYLLIFLWTDTKLIVNVELREKFSWRKTESFMIRRAKISAVRASGVRHLLTFLSQMRRSFK